MKINYIALLIYVSIVFGCNKATFLDSKPNTNIVVPQTLSDYTQLLDFKQDITPGLLILSADEYYYTTYASWQATYTATERNAYLWSKDIFGGEVQRLDWNEPYTAVFYANVVLDGFNNLPSTDQNSSTGKNIKGWALFERSFALYNLVQTFSPAYDSVTASTDLGIPLRLSSAIDQLLPRSSVKQTYNQILSDLQLASELVTPSFQTIYRNRPSKVAVTALLARIYLGMRNYPKAFIYADSTLKLYNRLLDYNTLDETSNSPFTDDNIEAICTTYSVFDYNSAIVGYSSSSIVDTNLYKSYSPNDLRSKIYFRISDGNGFVNNIDQASELYPFTGLATDEMYLIRAECQARNGNINDAMKDLNTMLQTRWKTGTYIPYSAVSAIDALSQILTERRKELIWRGIRWSDLKRLNKEGANITLTRQLNGQTYTLSPNSPNYVMPIPDDEVSLSGIPQNQRQ